MENFGVFKIGKPIAKSIKLKKNPIKDSKGF